MRRFLPPFLIFVAAYVYYFFQVCPSFYFWDSAELTAAVLLDGVPHPPGFPLVLILSKLWLAFTPLDDSYALNLFSAGFAAIGLSLWYLVICRALRYVFPRNGGLASGVIALICVTVMGLSLTYSIQATRFEVYSLNFALFAAIFYLALDLNESGYRILPGLLLSLFIGLALGVHPLTIALALPGIILLAYPRGKVEAMMFGGGIVLSVLVAAGLYATIFLAARKQPLLNWGDPSTLKGIMNYLFVREFSASFSSFSRTHIMENLTFVLNLLSRQVGPLGLLLAAAGLILLFLRRLALALTLSIIIVLNIFSTLFAENYFYENYDLHGYHLIFLALISLCASMSLKMLYNLLSGKSLAPEPKVDSRALLITAVAAALLFVLPVKNNLFSADLSEISGRDYASLFLEDSPDDAVVLTSYYNTYFCLLAWGAAYGTPENVSLIQCVYNWDHPWGRKQSGKAIDANLPLDSDRQTFYRNYLNAAMKKRLIYVEYDDSSRPIADYLVPGRLGYLFDPRAAASVDSLSGSEIEALLSWASQSDEIEWSRTWVNWFNNRGRFFNRIEKDGVARAYFDALEIVAGNAGRG